MTQKDIFLGGEGDAWFQRNLEKNHAFLDLDFLTLYLKNKKIEKHLEIGCSSGYKTSQLVKRLSSKGFGIDPSTKAISIGKKENFTLIESSELNLDVGTADDLKIYKDEFFDLVYLGFCMYLVDRELLQKSINEIDRVLKNGKFLSILDFDPGKTYSNSYKHYPGVRSFKENYADYFLKKGYSLLSKESYTSNEVGFTDNLDDRISIQLLQK